MDTARRLRTARTRNRPTNRTHNQGDVVGFCNQPLHLDFSRARRQRPAHGRTGKSPQLPSLLNTRPDRRGLLLTMLVPHTRFCSRPSPKMRKNPFLLVLAAVAVLATSATL